MPHTNRARTTNATLSRAPVRRRLHSWRAIAAFFLTLYSCPPAWSCDVNHPVVFAGLDWDSNAFHTALAQRILRDGMGCQVDQIPGSTIPLLNGLARGDVHLVMEVWAGNTPQSWTDGVAAGKLVVAGTSFPDAVQGWFVPKYLVQGEQAVAKGLRAVSDLPRYKSLFRDPEEPAKGRFLNCIAGWQCEVINSKKLHAYGLDDHFTNFRPGTGAALDAAILSALKRRRPVLFYYWGPTWLLGQVGDEVMMLEEPPYDAAKWQALMAAKEPSAVSVATAFPVVEVWIGANQSFLQRAPAIRAFLRNYRMSGAQVSQALAFMQRTQGSADDAARNFLKSHPALWRTWVTPEVARRVMATLP